MALPPSMVMKKKKKRQADGTQATEAAPESDLLADLGGDEDAGELKISEKFAAKYNAKKDKAELARANRILAEEGGGSESSESEDEEANLLTSRVNHRIFDTLTKIKSKDKSIYDSKHTFFTDQDFEEPAAASSSGSEKKLKYKDVLRKQLLEGGADAISKEEDALDAKERAAKAKRKKKGLTPMEEQQALKAEILAAANADGDDEDGLFTLKQKTAEELQQEDELFKDFTLRKDKQPGGDKGGQEADDIVARYWKADEDLNEGDQFLRDYLLNEGWKETTSLQSEQKGNMRGQMSIDADSNHDDEEEHLDDVDEFERDYNFRFEVEEGHQIVGHARFPEASVRQRSDTRKKARKEKAERKDAEKIRRTEELKRLKNLKKEEIQRRLQQLKDITGNEDTALGAIDIDADWDPNDHDKDVTKVLGKDFEDQEETLAGSELVQAPTGCEAELDVSNAAVEVIERRKRKGTVLAAGETNDAEDDGDGEEDDAARAAAQAEEEAQPGLWFLCDECQKPIAPGKKRFDCTVCEDYVLCAKCFRVRRHPCKFVRRKVPERCTPPEDWVKEDKTEEVENALDEYFQLDYEDIIGGDLPTRFKYRKAEKNGFGLTAKDILEKSDEELNRLMPMKKPRDRKSVV